MDPVLTALIILGIVSLFFLLSPRKWRPLQWLGKGVFHVVMGIFLLFLANVFGHYFGMYVPFNVLTIAIATVLGFPGVIGLWSLQWLLS